MASSGIVVPQLFAYHPQEFFKGGAFPDQIPILLFEPAVERLHLGIVFGSPQGIGDLDLVSQKQLPQPPVAGIHRIPVVMDNYFLNGKTQVFDCAFSHLPGSKSCLSVGGISQSPAGSDFAGMVNHGHQLGGFSSLAVSQPGKVGVEDLKRLDGLSLNPPLDFELDCQIHLVSQLDQGFDYQIGFGLSYLPGKLQMAFLHQGKDGLAVKTVAVILSQFSRGSPVAVAGMAFDHLDQILSDLVIFTSLSFWI